ATTGRRPTVIRLRPASLARSLYAVMVGEGRPSTSLRATESCQEAIIKVVPIRIVCHDQPDLPGSPPGLESLLPQDRRLDVLMALAIHKALQSITLGKAFQDVVAMFPDAPSKVAGDADVQRPIGTICHDVDPAALHAPHGCHRQHEMASRARLPS